MVLFYALALFLAGMSFGALAFFLWAWCAMRGEE